ncbi:MAG: MFS transporter [Hyphomicrobiales bacterium]|nr:MFS transporter [Hyphomicrobiales bacterium]
MSKVSTTDSASARRVVAAGIIGNVLEWYDFAIYGYFAFAIGQQFFPHQDKLAQLLSAFGVFALGYLMRPVGGVLIGHIGDRHGRRAALTFSVAAMAVPTFLIGFLPGYAAIGLAAPIALTLLRMVQGLSVGGEYTSSMVFLVEHAPPGRRGLMGALTTCGAVGGILLGSAVGAVFAASMSKAALEDWGWRIPFLLGLVVGIAGYLLRRHVPETPLAERRERPPILETLRDHWRTVLTLAGLSVFNAVTFYISFVYLVSWLQTADGIAPARALEINTLSMALSLPVLIASGLLADRIGRKPLLLAATMLGLLGALPVFWLLHHPADLLVQAGQLWLVLMVGLFCGVQPSVMVEAAPAHIRCTAVAVGYNITLGIVGGMTPLAAAWLVERTANDLSPAFLIMAAAAVTTLAISRLPETYRRPFTSAVHPKAA